MSPYGKAYTFIIQHDFMHLSFYKDDLARFVSTLSEEYQHNNYDFREFVDTLTVALREMEKAESPTAHIHPIIVRENQLAAVEADE